MATAENVWAWSTSAASNATADSSINWVEGQPADSVNNSARSMMAAIAKMANTQGGAVSTAGSTADAIIITTGQGISSSHQALGFRICFKGAFDNTGATTVAVDGLSAVAIKRPNGDALSAGDIQAGGFHDIAFDGSSGNYKLLVPGAGAAGTSGSLTGSNTWTGSNSFNGTPTTIGNDAADVVVIKGTTVHSTVSALMSSSSLSALRTAMGLGTAATATTGTSGATVPLLNGANTWSATQIVSVASGAAIKATAETGSASFGVLDVTITSAGLEDHRFQRFIRESASIGTITIAAGLTGVVYNATSDGRRKPEEHRRPITDSGEKIDALNPIYFRWDTGVEDFGFVAQEVYEVVPNAVTVGGDDVNADPWMMQKGGLEAILVAEIKALRARVTALEAK